MKIISRVWVLILTLVIAVVLVGGISAYVASTAYDDDLTSMQTT